MKGLNLAEWAIRHKQIVYFFIIAIFSGGLWSYFHLGRSEDPDFTIRQAVVTAAWPGASAQQITQQVTDPLEKKLQDTKGLDYIKSFTHDGKTVIYVNLKDLAVLKNVVNLTSRDFNGLGRNLDTINEKPKSDVKMTITTTYKKLKSVYFLSGVQVEYSYKEEGKEVKGTMEYITTRVNRTSPTVIEGRIYYEDIEANEEFWNRYSVYFEE